MTLGDMLKRAVHSDRLIIQEADGREIYRGYVACIQYHDEIDAGREVKRFGMAVDIFRKENREKCLGVWREPKTEVAAESIGDFQFSDLEMMVYTRIVLEGRAT